MTIQELCEKWHQMMSCPTFTPNYANGMEDTFFSSKCNDNNVISCKCFNVKKKPIFISEHTTVFNLNNLGLKVDAAILEANELLVNKIDYILTPTIANTPYNAIIT